PFVPRSWSVDKTDSPEDIEGMIRGAANSWRRDMMTTGGHHEQRRAAEEAGGTGAGGPDAEGTPDDGLGDGEGVWSADQGQPLDEGSPVEFQWPNLGVTKDLSMSVLGELHQGYRDERLVDAA